MSDIPRWDTQSLYKSFKDPKWEADLAALISGSRSLVRLAKAPEGSDEEKAKWVEKFWKKREGLLALGSNLMTYGEILFTVDTKDERAQKELGRVEESLLPLKQASVIFRSDLGAAKIKVSKIIALCPKLKPFKTLLEEEILLSSKQMSAELEDLAADLQRSGADAFSRLRESVSSQISVVWNEKKGEKKTVVELRQLAMDPGRDIRKKAFDLELGAWKTWEIPLAACLNGVKGTSVTLNKRRGWKNPLDLAALQNRLSPKALESMISAMEESLPQFRKYLKLKAKALGIEKLGFYDLFAPVGSSKAKWTFEKARDFIIEKFSGFSQDLGDFAKMAFEKKWIDALPREGKVGGAYCVSFPLAKEPRILSNFSGTFGDVKTLAHELGHGYHFWLVRDLSASYQDYPMALAETASIFAETIVFEQAMKTLPRDEALALLENELQDQTQVLVDILSRFYFEREVFARREKGEISAGEFCQIMEKAQKDTYGDGLNKSELHPYMWAAKVHYYSPDLGFYNFPYAFGLLFSLALYGRFKTEGSSFVKKYQILLKETGIKTAVDLAAGLGYDLETPEFWKEGLKVFYSLVKDFEKLLKGKK